MKRSSTTIFMVALSWASFATAQIRLETPSTLAQIGSGYDAFTGEVRGDCVDPGGMDQIEGSNTFFEVLLIENERDFSKRLSVSAKAKYGLFSAGGSSVSETTFNSYSVYMAVVARVDARTIAAKSPTLRAEVRQLAESDPARFRQRCGNFYVRSNTRGGEYSALVEVFTSTEAEYQDSKVAAKGATGVFSASGEASAKINNVLKNRRYTVKLIRKGGQGPVANGADAILGSALAYPVEVNKLADNQLFAARVDVQDYLSLSVPDSLRKGVLSDTEALLRIERYDSIAQQRREHLANIEYILGNPEQFAPHDVSALRSHAQALRDVLFEMKSAVALCFDAVLRKCAPLDFKDPPSNYQITLPARLPGPTRQELAAQVQALQARIDRSSGALQRALSEGFSLGKVESPINCQLFAAGFGIDKMGAAISACVRMHEEVRKFCARSGCTP